VPGSTVSWDLEKVIPGELSTPGTAFPFLP
jgi:hypothetical protein